MTEKLWTFGIALGGETAELHGLSVEALDGRLGKVEDVVDRVGDAYLLVDTGPSAGGKAVMLPAGVVVAVDAPKGSIFVGRTKQDVMNAPQYNPGAPEADHHDALTAYYTSREKYANAPASGTQASTDRPNGAATSTGQDQRGKSAQGRPEITSQARTAPTRSGDEATRGTRLTKVGPSSDGAGRDALEADTEKAEAQASTGTGGVASTSKEAITAETPTSQKASPDVAEKRPSGTEEKSKKKRPRRGADSSASRSGSGSSSERKSRSGASSRSSGKVPIARYDSLTAAEVNSRLRNLSQRKLAEAERYEKAHERRQTVLGRIDDLREDEPWRGYDNATVDEVKKKLTAADDARAKAVRDYERRHRDRKGVRDAARRTFASA